MKVNSNQAFALKDVVNDPIAGRFIIYASVICASEYYRREISFGYIKKPIEVSVSKNVPTFQELVSKNEIIEYIVDNYEEFIKLAINGNYSNFLTVHFEEENYKDIIWREPVASTMSELIEFLRKKYPRIVIPKGEKLENLTPYNY